MSNFKFRMKPQPKPELTAEDRRALEARAEWIKKIAAEPLDADPADEEEQQRYYNDQ